MALTMIQMTSGEQTMSMHSEVQSSVGRGGDRRWRGFRGKRPAPDGLKPLV